MKPFKLPVRVQFAAKDEHGREVTTTEIRTSGQDAGWTVLDLVDLEHARQIMRRYPSARMPCWSRIEACADETMAAEEMESVRSVVNSIIKRLETK